MTLYVFALPMAHMKIQAKRTGTGSRTGQLKFFTLTVLSSIRFLFFSPVFSYVPLAGQKRIMSLQFCKSPFWLSFSCIISFVSFSPAMLKVFFDNAGRPKYKQYLQVAIRLSAFEKPGFHLFFLRLSHVPKLASGVFQKNLKSGSPSCLQNDHSSP